MLEKLRSHCCSGGGALLFERLASHFAIMPPFGGDTQKTLLVRTQKTGARAIINLA